MPDDALPVLFDADIFLRQRVGGISRMFAQLARALPGAGIAPRIFAPWHINEFLSDLPPGFFPAGRRRIAGRYPLAAARRIPAMVTRLAARGFGAGLVHATYYPRRCTAPAGMPLVITMHDMIHELDPDFAGDPVIGWKAAAIARADRVVCVSEHTRQDMIGLYPASAGKSSVVPLAADLPDASSAPRPQPRGYLLYVGDRSRGYKNFRALFEAYRTLPAAAELDLVAIGGGGFTADEQTMIAEAGLTARVRQQSPDDRELAAWYHHAACLVYPSTYEGFGIPPLEAMAAGCPVIALRLSSVPEVCGDAACYAEGRGPEALAAAIARVLDDSAYAARLRDAGRTRAAQFSWHRSAAQYAAIYRELAG